jgi:hypothetical protein
MTWQQEWSAIADRIERLVRTCEYASTGLRHAPGDPRGIIRKWIAPEALAITDLVEGFAARYRGDLPDDAVKMLDEFLKENWFTKQPELINTNLVSVAALTTLRSAFDYAVRDIEADARNRTEQAFEHLRRLLLVDDEIRDRWLRDYADTRRAETLCERRGAVHLMHHGIVAFKASGERSVTDLILNEPLNPDASVLRRAARAAALTEWKIVRKASDVAAIAAGAARQAEIYAGGVLGQTELTRTRYLVLVSDQRLDPPDDFVRGDVHYRHICIELRAIAPSAEGKAAATAKRTGAGGSKKES